jgi:transposase
MKAYSKEFRREVLAACDGGMGTRAAATKFGVSEAWVRKIKQDRRELGKLAPATKRKRVPKWAAEAERIVAIQRAKPDLTLRELKAELGTELSVQTLCRALQQLKLTLKKRFEG